MRALSSVLMMKKILPEWPARLARHPLAEWAWLVLEAPSDMPRLFAFEAVASQLQRSTTCDRAAPTLGLQAPHVVKAEVHFDVLFMTYNVLTLLDRKIGASQAAEPAGMKIKGKRHLIVQQCLAAGVHCLGLQETRLQATSTLPDKEYIMLHAAATPAGHHGCALWLSKTLPYAHCDGKPLYFAHQHCTATAFSARHLLVTVEAPHFRCLILVAHAPTDPTDATGAVAAFWRQCDKDISRVHGHWPLVVLTDANSRVGSSTSLAVGPLDGETETVAGGLFHDFLLKHHLGLPATQADHHSGPSWTWHSPLGDRHRIDYIAVPQAWMGFDLASSTWVTFESMQQRYDHIPVRLRCRFRAAPKPDSYVGSEFRRVACRPNDLDPKLNRAAFLERLQRHPLPEWQASVDDHFATLVHHWIDAGRQVTVKGVVVPRQSFLTAGTMQLVALRKALRRYLRDEEAELRRRYLTLTFAAFLLHCQHRTATVHARRHADLGLQVMHISIAKAWSYLGQTCTHLRAAVRTDRNKYLEQLVKDVSLADLRNPKQLFHRVRKAFPKAAAARRTRFIALPAVELADGSLATSLQAREDRWREHFSDQEFGKPVTPSEFCSAIAETDMQRKIRPAVFDPALLPSLLALEDAIHGLSRSKASGPDGITAELLKLAPVTAARHLVVLHLKSTLALQEPIEYKGGALMTLAKRVGAAFACGRYRSILLSSVPGKLFHRDLRNKLTPTLKKVCCDLHGGVREGIGVDTIALAVKCFQAYVSVQGHHPGIVFYDVRAAYYQVLRECLTGATLEDKVLLRLFTRLGVPAEAFEELHVQLSRLAILADSGCTPHTVELLKEVFTGTWFRLDQSAPLVSTAAGVRPGDPLADVLFAISFSAYARSVQEAIATAGLTTNLPPGQRAAPWAAGEEDLALGPASWADDFAVMHSAPTPSELILRVQTTTSLYLTHATANGIELAFAADKTAAVLPPQASHMDHPEVVHRDQLAFLPVVDGITGRSELLPIVQAYKHLGGIVTSTHTVVPEIHFRHSQAAWTLRPLRGPLFGNPSIPLATRRHLLQSLVASKFVFGSATLELHVAGHFRLWARLYTAFYRALQPREALRSKLHSYEVLRTAKVCTPPLALAKARAGFLLRICERGPESLRRLLWLQWEARPQRSWLGQLKQDLEHVLQYCPGVKVVLGAPCPITALLEAVEHDRTWWQRQVKKAIQICLKDLDTWKRASPPETADPIAPSVPPAQDLFVCPLCPAAFPLRKHLGVHMARSHALVAPARLYAVTPTCVACLRYCHTLPRLQQHLKVAKPCLLRACDLMAPMTLAEVKEVEAADKAKVKALKKGDWQQYTAAPPALQALGPAQPSRAELRAYLQDDMPLTLLYDPPQDDNLVAWVRAEAGFTTKEPARTGTCSFWHHRVGQAS